MQYKGHDISSGQVQKHLGRIRRCLLLMLDIIAVVRCTACSVSCCEQDGCFVDRLVKQMNSKVHNIVIRSSCNQGLCMTHDGGYMQAMQRKVCTYQ